MSQPLSDRLRTMQSEFDLIVETIPLLEAERDYYKRMAAQWAEVVDRQRCTYAEQVQLDEFARSLTV